MNAAGGYNTSNQFYRYRPTIDLGLTRKNLNLGADAKGLVMNAYSKVLSDMGMANDIVDRYQSTEFLGSGI